MKKNIAVVDCFVCTPVIYCFNNLVNSFDNCKLTYHATNFFSVNTLKSLKSIDGMIILGSASNVTEPLPWHKELGDFTVDLLKKNIPVLGICFGHQLICHTFGCKVDYHTVEKKSFIGNREVSVTKDAFGLKQSQKYNLIVSHQQTVQSIVPDMESIGTSHLSPNDIIIHKKYPFLGLQPHPEASKNFVIEEGLALSDSEFQKIEEDGMNLIKTFFKHFNLT